MKNVRKVLTLMLSAVMMMALTINAFAAEIVVENAYEGETYTAYKLLEYTSNKTTTIDEETGDEVVVPATAFSYYLSDTDYQGNLGSALKAAGFEFTQSADGTQWFVSNTAALEGKGAEIAASLYASLDDWKDSALATATTVGKADKTAVFEDLETGYWFVTSSLGSLCTLQTYDDEQLVVEKNSILPPPEKTVSDTEAQVGDVLDYKVTLTDVKGTNKKAYIIDTMSEGLTFNDDAALVATITTDEGTETRSLDKDTDYTESVDTASGNTVITWEISAELMTEMEEGDTIVVTYTATVNEKASIDGTELNTASVRQSEQQLDGEPVEVETSWLKIKKTDGSEAIKGAKFELYREVTEEGEEGSEATTSQVAVNLTQMTAAEAATALGTKDPETGEVTPGTPDADTIYYKVDRNSTSNVIDMTDYSKAHVFGLDKDSTYYLTETVAPEGYNLLDEQVKVVLESDNDIEIENKPGSVLPSTGGIGTTIFYTVGTILVLSAGVILVSKRRMGAN